MPVSPESTDFDRTVRESFARQRLMSTLGVKLISVTPGAVEIALPFRDDLTQQSGVAHAGVLASIADSACGYAALTLMPAGSDVVSIEFKLNLVAPAKGEHLIARGRVVRAGKTITTAAADVFAVEAGVETLVATMLGTMMRRLKAEG